MTRRTEAPEADASAFFDAEVMAWKEKRLQSEIVRAAKELGWGVQHTYFSDRSQAGWPDLVLVRDRIVFAELKTTKGPLSPAQQVWINCLAAAGGEVYVWRPREWLSGEVLEVLTRGDGALFKDLRRRVRDD